MADEAQANGDTPKAGELIRRHVRIVKPSFTAEAEWPHGSGKMYGIRSLVDLKNKQMLQILSDLTPDGLKRANNLAAIARVQETREKLRLLVPDLEDEILDEMTWQEMLAFMDAALGVGEENPQSEKESTTS